MRSKGVMQSHNVWIKAAINGAITSELREGEVLYCCLPMYQSAAWVANVFRALVTGVPCAIDARFSAKDFWNRCRHYGATMTFTLGAMHTFLWNAPERPDDADNPVRTASMIPMPEAEAELKIVVVRRSGETLDAEGLARFINENAPHFFVPRYIEFVDELPMTPTGRVQKFKLRERGVTSETWDARAEGFVVSRD